MIMIRVDLSSKIKNICPEMTLALLYCEVENSLRSESLWNELEAEAEKIRQNHRLDEINKRQAIATTRQVYKALGKDPNRYRPSAEALSRRIVRGLPLYNVNTLVDIINIVSIRSGYSIGGFDADKIQGNVEQGVGYAEEPFEAIGRGLLNVEALPIYRDEAGGIGTPTSDNERTKIDLDTKKLFVIINAYDGSADLEKTVDHMLDLLKRYASLKVFELNYLR